MTTSRTEFLGLAREAGRAALEAEAETARLRAERQAASIRGQADELLGVSADRWKVAPLTYEYDGAEATVLALRFDTVWVSAKRIIGTCADCSTRTLANRGLIGIDATPNDDDRHVANVTTLGRMLERFEPSSKHDCKGKPRRGSPLVTKPKRTTTRRS